MASPAPSQAPTPAPPSETRRTAPTLDDLALPRKGRGLLVGMTESGKSTLAEKLIDHWLETYGDKARILILDSKPRFRADKRLDGWPAKRLYRHWDHGTTIPNSYLLQLRHEKEFEQVWRQGGRVAIAQGNLGTLPQLRWAASRFYHHSRSRYAQLVYADEWADFYGSSGLSSRGDPLLQIVRSGRERGVSFLAATQRPKGIPQQGLTELTNLYFFHTPFEQDIERVREMGLTDVIDRNLLAREEHSFYFFSRKREQRPLTGYYRLHLAR